MMTLGSDMLTSPAKETGTVRIVWQLEHKSALHYSLFVGLPIEIVLHISFSISQWCISYAWFLVTVKL
jgi:hypothetical protein